MEIKLLASKNAVEIANLHLISFPRFFLTTLGKQFLVTFYKSILLSESGFGVGIFENDKLVSFAIGTKKPRNFYLKLIKKHGLSLLKSCILKILLNPLIGFRILINLMSKGTQVSFESGALLLSICSDPQKWGSGLSTLVLNAFEEKAIKLKCKEVYLTTDFFKNERVNSFYSKSGYIVVDVFLTGNKRKMNLYSKKLYQK